MDVRLIQQTLKSHEIKNISKVILGTAQFGMNYGLTKESRELDKNKTFEILNEALKNKIKMLDTAHAYGFSEKIIGDWINSSNKNKIRIITKIPKLAGGYGSKEANKYFNQSLVNLRSNNIDILLMHESVDVFKDGIMNWAEELIHLKKIKFFGVSTYNIKDIFPIHPSIKVIQMPLNIFNQNNIEGDLASDFLSNGGQIHVRSVFVQGLILMDPLLLPSYLESCKEPIKRFQSLAKEAGVLPESLAIASVMRLLPRCQIVMGVHSSQQLASNLELLDEKIDGELVATALKLGKTFSGNIWDPRRW